MTGSTDLLAALLAAVADVADVAEAHADGETSWARAGNRFALVRGSTVELRVGAPIAAAALRTSDTSSSLLGPDWIAFAPAVLDGPARDRLVAWFAAAGRRAGGQRLDADR